jgi:hypothetical protein
MTKHKTEDYKISAVKYYLNNDKGDGYKKTCKIFDCKSFHGVVRGSDTAHNMTITVDRYIKIL